jgi:GNAT superfamily N-acetyltransferase
MACAMSPGGVQRQKPPVSPLRAAAPSPETRVNYRIVAVSDHPEMAPAVAKWLLDAFRHDLSPSHDELTAQLLAQKAPSEETFILLADGVPVGTASLVKNDLPSRPDLTPWLASVLVRPQFRGKGYSTPLVKHVEEAATAAAVKVLWLYTWSAEPLYARLGWERAGLERDADRDIEVVLMKRELP